MGKSQKLQTDQPHGFNIMDVLIVHGPTNL